MGESKADVQEACNFHHSLFSSSADLASRFTEAVALLEEVRQEGKAVLCYIHLVVTELLVFARHCQMHGARQTHTELPVLCSLLITLFLHRYNRSVINRF